MGSVIAASCTLFDESLADFRSPQTVELQGDPLVFESPNGFDCRVALYLQNELKTESLPPPSIGDLVGNRELSASFALCLIVEVLSGADGRRNSRSVRIAEELYVLRRSWRRRPFGGCARGRSRGIRRSLDSATTPRESGRAARHLCTARPRLGDTLCHLARAAEQVSDHGEFGSVEDMHAARRPIARVLVEVAKSGGIDPEELCRCRHQPRPRPKLCRSPRRNAQDHLRVLFGTYREVSVL